MAKKGVALLSLLCVVLTCNGGITTNIVTMRDFKDFVNNVNNGTSYASTTVMLNIDIDMEDYPGSFEPIGREEGDVSSSFDGAFYGRGHVVSNLNISSDKYRSLGLFGLSKGSSIYGLIIDRSCSFENKFSSNGNSVPISTGSILGHCVSTDGDCIIGNCVNTAAITHTGTGTDNIYLGGIVGSLRPDNNSTQVHNCVN